MQFNHAHPNLNCVKRVDVGSGEQCQCWGADCSGSRVFAEESAANSMEKTCKSVLAVLIWSA